MKSFTHVSHGSIFLGLTPKPHLFKTVPLSNYLTPKAVPYPTKIAWERPISWGMLGNDQIGDCLVGGTKVSAFDVQGGMRIPYNGPVITLLFCSGNRLTVTPHHAILTPRGFLPACLLKQGDNVVGSAFPEQIACGFEPNLDQSPATIEEKFSSLSSVPNVYKRLAVPFSIDLNGDERFIDGNVDVIGPKGLLQSELYPTLRKPHCKRQIRTPSDLQCAFSGSGAAFQAPRVGWLSAFGSVSASREPSSPVRVHLGIKNAKRLGLGSQSYSGRDKLFFDAPSVESNLRANVLHCLSSFIVRDEFPKVRKRISSAFSLGKNSLGLGERPCYASRLKPSRNSGPTDAHLFGQLGRRFPGLVSLDSVKDVSVTNSFSGHVYDLSTKSRWYTANGIITHNCVIAWMMHHDMALRSVARAGSPVAFTTAQAIETYSAITGYILGDDSTDNGTDPQTAAQYWQSTGLYGHKIDGFVSVDPTNLEAIKAAHYLFGGLGLAIDVPDYIMQVAAGGSWTYAGSGSKAIDGGHMIYAAGYGKSGMTIVSWGAPYTFSYDFLSEYCRQIIAVVSTDWIKASGLSPSGVDLQGLLSELKADAPRPPR